MEALAGGGGPLDPIPGDPDQMQSLATQLATLAQGLEDAVVMLTSVDAGDWKGPAADAFRSVVHQQPSHYEAAGAAFSVAATAVASYAEALADAQAMAVRAQDYLTQGQIATSNWVNSAPTGRPPQGRDPGEADTALGHRLLAEAHDGLAQAARGLIAALRDAESAAPRKPSLLDEITGDAWDVIKAPFVFTGNVVGGFAEGTWSMVTGVWDLAAMADAETNPMMRLIDPGAYQQANSELSALGKAVTQHPGQFFKDLGENLVDWKQWSSNPGRALGELGPGVLLAIASGGLGAAAKGVEGAAGAASTGAEVMDGISSAAAAAGVSTLGQARAMELFDTALEQSLPDDGLKTAVTLINLNDEAALYDQAAAQQAASEHLAGLASSLRNSSAVLEETAASLNDAKDAIVKLSRANDAASGVNAVIGTGQQVTGAHGNPGGEHLVDGTAASKAGERAGEKIGEPEHIHLSTPSGEADFSFSGK